MASLILKIETVHLARCIQLHRVDSLRGVNTQEAIADRAHNSRAQVEHDTMHLGSRMELDKAGLHAFVDPRHIWTLLVDAATQRNFMLPKFKFRCPKNLAGRPFWSYKLMASYAYGYGFSPFLVHNSQHMGANLTWTVIWLTLCRMRKHYGFWPRVLHITVDNTTGENKNETLLAMCAWLVASGKMSQVRVLFLMVGHTHVIIDHIFGVITVGLRRKEMLVPDDLVQNINASLAKNPQYMAKPVSYLHCLWDFKQWCLSKMNIVAIGRIFKGNVQDKEVSYSGMYDLLFGKNGTDFPTLKYREHPTHPWLPEGSAGAQVIAQLPDTPPMLQKIKPWAEWSMDGSRSVKDTILLFLDFARSADTSGMTKAIVLSIWQTHYNQIPNSIDLLPPHLQLQFEYFDDLGDDVLRIGMRNAEPDERTPEADKEYEEWKRQNIDLRTHPLAVDPVISSEQSSAEFESKKRALQATLRSGRIHPTIVRTSPILLGDFVIVQISPSSGVDLYSVTNMNGMKNPYATDIAFRAIQYEHIPNPAVGGLFGTFKMKLTLGDGVSRQQSRTMLHRSQVIVFNARLERMDKKKNTRVLSLRSLRALALALPNVYPFPERAQIPESHLSLSDDEDESTDGHPRHKQGRGKAVSSEKRPAARAGSRTKRPAAVDSSDDDSSSDSDPSEVSTSDTDGGCTDQSDGAYEETDGLLAEPTTRNVLFLTGPTVEPKLNTIVALNMVGDPEYIDFKYPVGIAFVVNVEPFHVCWYSLPPSQLQAKQGREKARPFKNSNKFLTFQKFFKDPQLFKSRRKDGLTEKEIMDNWYMSEAHRNWILDVDVPQPADVTKVRRSDRFQLEMSFVEKTLIPACEAASCVHNL